MSPQNILQSDVLDILFEHRNKDYGAYNLRRTYPQRIKLSMITVLLITGGLALLNLYKGESAAQNWNPPVADSLKIIEIIIPKEAIKPPEPEMQQPQAPQAKTIDNNTIVVVPDILSTEPIHTVAELEHAIISNVNIEGKEVGFNQVPDSKKGSGGFPGTGTTITETPAESEIFWSVQQMPQFPGGTEALKKYLLRNLRQPDDMEEGQKIIVHAKFILREDGSIDAAEITRSGRTDLDNEVLRVINKMPKWRPGIQNGRNVAVYFTLPVTFMGE